MNTVDFLKQTLGPADTYEADHAALVAYLLSAVRRSDWHAVSDAANDLRVLEARRGR